MSSTGGPQPADNLGGEAESSVRKSTPDLLRHVLEETLARGESGMTHEEWQILQAIARENLQREIDMHQVAELLVGGLLATRFPDLASPDANRLMCQSIATSLCADPTSMHRLKTFWNHLRQSIT